MHVHLILPRLNHYQYNGIIKGNQRETCLATKRKLKVHREKRTASNQTDGNSGARERLAVFASWQTPDMLFVCVERQKLHTLHSHDWIVTSFMNGQLTIRKYKASCLS